MSYKDIKLPKMPDPTSIYKSVVEKAKSIVRNSQDVVDGVDVNDIIDINNLPNDMPEMEKLRWKLLHVTSERDRLQQVCDEVVPKEYIECPKCNKQHIEGTLRDNPKIDGRKRPHHTHRCYHCGNVWDEGRWSFGAPVPKPVNFTSATRIAE